MAIKGKGRTKQGRRTVTRGPRPGYVEPPKPLVKRTWFRVTVIAILAIGAVAIVASLILIKQSNDRKEAKADLLHRQQGRVQQYAGPVIQYLQGVAEPLGGGTQVAAFQNAAAQLAGLKSGDVSTEDAVTAGKNMANNAAVGAKNIENLDVTKAVSGFPDLLDLLDSQELLAGSLRVYEQIGNLMVQAANAPEDERDDIIKTAQKLIPVAGKLFTDGYQKLVNAQISAGLPPNVFPVPQPTPTPTAVPSPTPEPSASASPSAEPSPSGSGGGSGKGGGNGGGNGGGGGGKGNGGGTPKATASAGG
jgi:uncharacterized membrane protein YgcG